MSQTPMRLFICFVGRAEALAEQYEGVTAASFLAQDWLPALPHRTLELPRIEDRLRVRMSPQDTREFRCTGRLFDFSEAGAPVLHIELDMP